MTIRRFAHRSILLRLSLFFLLIIAAIAVAAYYLHANLERDMLERMTLQTEQTMRMMRRYVLLEPLQRQAAFEAEGYLYADDPQSYERLFDPPRPRLLRLDAELESALGDGRIRMAFSRQRLYWYFPQASPPYVIASPVLRDDRALFYALLGGIAALLLIFYASMVRSLLPLHRLAAAIEQYGESGWYDPVSLERGDEIAYVAEAFEEAVRKNRALTDSRRLFLRNVMHELKTPITAAKVAAVMVEAGEPRRILERSFERLQQLIARMASVEQVSSGALHPRIASLKFATLIEQALADLMTQNDAVLCEADCEATIEADEEMMVTVFKNLIDNALKYASDHRVRIRFESDSVVFANRGEPWPEGYTLETLTQPFVHRAGANRSQSFGLGLYLIRSLVERQGGTLRHLYADGEHRFMLEGFVRPIAA